MTEFYLSILQKHPVPIVTGSTSVGPVKALLVCLWIQRGVYQSHPDCGTDSIISTLMLLLMIFPLKMLVSCRSCYSRRRPGNHRWETVRAGLAAHQLDFDKNVNGM